ncbi:MAG: HNH endonuclease [Elusimicrobia bacterium]|nr:HNH endonuclease [Elusimicrobiota bacterium]
MDISDDELRQALRRLAVCERTLIGDLLRHLMEADARRLAGPWGYTSLYVYCTTELRFSEGATYKRINAARLAARVPLVLEYLDAGKVHLDALVSLAANLTLTNAREVLERATGMTSRDVQVLVAELAPKPDRPDFLRSMPAPVFLPPAAVEPGTQAAPARLEIPTAGSGVPGDAAPPPPAIVPNDTPVPAADSADAALVRTPRLIASTPHDRVEPRSPGRHYVGFTAGDGLREKLQRAQALMRSSNADAPFEYVIEQALDAWLDQKDPLRLAALRNARRRVTNLVARRRRFEQPKRPWLPRSVRDAVLLRDGGRCTYHPKGGVRCAATTGLEIDHIVPRAKGGTDELSNLRLLCREHNRSEAVREFGQDLVGPQRRGKTNESGRRVGQINTG